MTSHAIRLLFILLLGVAASRADTPPPPQPPPAISPDALDQAIETVIARPEYSWRLPRECRVAETSDSGFWEAFWHHVGNWMRDAIDGVVRFIKRFYNWVRKHFPEHVQPDSPHGLNWQISIQVFLFALSALTASLLAVFLYRLWKRRSPSPSVTAVPLPNTAVDLANENIGADQLPSEAWTAMAEDLLHKGQTRLAIRAMFLASLSSLGHSTHITLARHKSNREYLRELHRKAHDHPPLLDAFSQNVDAFERVWYGKHPATEILLANFTRNQNCILSSNAA